MRQQPAETTDAPDPKLARAKPERNSGVYFRAGGFYHQTNLGETHIKLQSSFPIDSSKLDASGIDVMSLIGPVDVGTAVMSTQVNPLIVQAGIGADF